MADPLEKLVDDLENDADSLGDDGHLNLMEDVTELLKEVQDGTYHDFHRNGVTLPKVALVNRLENFIISVKNGRYDN